jgi:hypothetical protein
MLSTNYLQSHLRGIILNNLRAQNLASVLSYPSNEIHDILVLMSTADPLMNRPIMYGFWEQ